MSEIEYRPYQPGDEVAITKLFETVFSQPMSPAFWRWRFLEHPAGGPLISLAFDGEILAGHYSACHAPLSLLGEVRPACLSMTTMTHPDYRGRRMFENVGGRLYEYLSGVGMTAIYGFPNTVSHAVFLTRLGWYDTYEVPTLILDTAAWRLQPVDPRVKEVSSVDARFTRLWNELAPTIPVSSLRDEATLAWRVDRNPVNIYTRLVLEDGDEIVGYAITKPYGERDLDLVELRCLDNSVAKVLIDAVSAKAISEGRTRIATWSMPRDTSRRAFEAAGYKPGAPVTFFGGCTFADLGVDLSDARLWHISMLDSDLY